MAKNIPTLMILKRLRPLSEFNEEQLSALAQELNIQTARHKELVLPLGDTDDSFLFILEGEVKMTSRDEHESIHSPDKGSLLNPLAQLRPSMYSVHAVKAVQYITIPKQLLTLYSSYGMTDINQENSNLIEDNPIINELTLQICTDMMNDKLSLPSLPEIALKIQRVYQDDMADLNSIADIITIDPAISAKLIKIANSLVYQGEVPTETLKAAITRLGLDTTYKQVMAYAVNDLFKSHSSSLKEKMTELWSHSRKVAAISYLLAKETKLFNPELAMLAGLVHDLGTIVILDYLEKSAKAKEDAIDSEMVVNTLRSVVTGMLMKKWNFTAETIIVAEECEDWFRNPKDDADLCDIVMLAQYHSFIGTDAMKGLPSIATLPAMKKLGLSPVDSISLLKNSKDKIKAMESLFQ